MDHDVVVTGIGLVLPKTQSIEDLWDCKNQTMSCIEALSPRICGSQIEKVMPSGGISSRLLKKLDVFTQYALLATQAALDDAGINLNEVNRERGGVFVGNSFGGWRFTENELRNLHGIGPRAVSPFQATSWFPAAPQGQITIAHGLKGYSKTYMADRLSSLISIGSAANIIRRGELDFAIAGGTESTNTDFVRTALEHIALENGDENLETSGFEISEGSVFLILENKSHAKARGARIYARVDALSLLNSPSHPNQYGRDSSVLKNTMRCVLENKNADIIIPDASGLRKIDNIEQTAIDAVCPNAIRLRPKQRYGNTFGAEGALNAAFASLILHHQKLPQMSSVEHEPSSLSTPKTAKTSEIGSFDTVLINACSLGGATGSLLLTKEM